MTGVLTVREIVDALPLVLPAPLPVERALALAGLEEQGRRGIDALGRPAPAALLRARDLRRSRSRSSSTSRPWAWTSRRGGPSWRHPALSGAGKTIVFTTHYLREAEELARRIIVIDRGVVIADATPRELKARVPGKEMTLGRGPAARRPPSSDGPARARARRERRAREPAQQRAGGGAARAVPPRRGRGATSR